MSACHHPGPGGPGRDGSSHAPHGHLRHARGDLLRRLSAGQGGWRSVGHEARFPQKAKAPAVNRGLLSNDCRRFPLQPPGAVPPLGVIEIRLARAAVRRPGFGESRQPLGRLLLDQLERGLGALVGLGEHRGAGLHQNVPAGELG